MENAATKTAVAIGYASLDYPVILDGNFQGDHTVMVKSRPKDAFPRPGGSPRYVARSLVGGGVSASVITWVGSDDMGELFYHAIKADGINDDGIAVIKSEPTPLCLMLYQQDGSCGCCFDPGFMGREVLTANQGELIQKADLVCITVGPAKISQQALSMASDKAVVAWVAKNDPISYPQELCEQLGERADYIFCNEHERSWIDDALKSRTRLPPLIIETRGARNLLFCKGKEMATLAINRIDVNDTCGAGDTLAGGCLAAVMNGEIDSLTVARAVLMPAN